METRVRCRPRLGASDRGGVGRGCACVLPPNKKFQLCLKCSSEARGTTRKINKMRKGTRRKNGRQKLCNLVFVSSPFSVGCIPPAPSWRRVLLPHILRVVDVVRCRLYFWACVRFPLLILGGGACTHLAFDVACFHLRLLVGAAPDADK